MVEFELIDLGLLRKHDIEKQDSNSKLFKKYFMHGVSHHIGLNVHDYGQDIDKPLAPSMVLTCEPGIYVQEEKLGVRLENNILITEDNPVDLTEDIPIEVEEIEYFRNNIS